MRDAPSISACSGNEVIHTDGFARAQDRGTTVATVLASPSSSSPQEADPVITPQGSVFVPAAGQSPRQGAHSRETPQLQHLVTEPTVVRDAPTATRSLANPSQLAPAQQGSAQVAQPSQQASTVTSKQDLHWHDMTAAIRSTPAMRPGIPQIPSAPVSYIQRRNECNTIQDYHVFEDKSWLADPKDFYSEDSSNPAAYINTQSVHGLRPEDTSSSQSQSQNRTDGSSSQDTAAPPFQWTSMFKHSSSSLPSQAEINYEMVCTLLAFDPIWGWKQMVAAAADSSALYIEIKLSRFIAKALLDTGATRSFMSKAVFKQINEKNTLTLLDGTPFGAATTASGLPLDIVGHVNIPTSIGHTTRNITFQIVDKLCPGVIIGLKDMQAWRLSLELGDLAVWVPDDKGSGERVHSWKPTEAAFAITAVEPVTLDPGMASVIWCAVEAQAGTTGIVQWASVSPTAVASVLATVLDVEGATLLPLVLFNSTQGDEITLHTGQPVASFEPLSDEQERLCSVFEDVSGAAIWNDSHAAIAQTKRQTQRTRVLAKEVFHKVCYDRSDLSAEQKGKLLQSLEDYAHCFAEDPKDLGSTDLIKHYIATDPSVPPIAKPTRRSNFARLELERTSVAELYKTGKIRPSNSPWSAPVVMVPKKDGKLRFCIDYRALNEVTKKDAYPLPRIADELACLHGAKFFSTLDLCSGYWQVEIAEADRCKSAFSVAADGGSHWEWTVMPFGLCNAPSTFQRLLDLVLAGVKWKHALVYIDDIIIYSKTFDQHLLDIKDIMTRLEAAGLRAKLSKCNFAAKQVSYLGHSVTELGIGLDPRHIEKIKKFPRPANTEQLHMFVGLASFFRRFVKQFAKVARPLHDLLKPGALWKWESPQEDAFQALINRLTSSPILAHPDFAKPFTLYTDACKIGLGAVLTQRGDDGLERAIAYASRQTRGKESDYSTTQLECLAVVWAVENFAPFLWGKRFSLITDHSALVSLFRMEVTALKGQMARWVLRLSPFDFQVFHRAGQQNAAADALSRSHHDGAPYFVMPTPPFVHASDMHTPQQVKVLEQSQQVLSIMDPDFAAKLREAQDREPLWREAKQWLKIPESDRPPPKNALLADLLKTASLEDDILKVEGVDKSRVTLLPYEYRLPVILQAHDFGHSSCDKTRKAVQASFYWYEMKKDIDDVVKHCPTCAQGKARQPTRQGAPGSLPKARGPNALLAMDHIGPFPKSKRGNTHVLVVEDLFTRWCTAIPVPDTGAETTVDALISQVVAVSGIPDAILSDNGSGFTANFTRRWSERFHMQQKFSSPLHPQGNGAVERLNGTLKRSLTCLALALKADWEENLPMVVYAYNCTEHAATGETPFFLRYGRDAVLPSADLLKGPESRRREELDMVARFRKLYEAWDMARKKTLIAAERSRDRLSLWRSDVTFEIGDFVWCYTPAGSAQTDEASDVHVKWSGPYVITAKGASNLTYVIDKPSGPSGNQTVHVSRLRKHKFPIAELPVRQPWPGARGAGWQPLAASDSETVKEPEKQPVQEPAQQAQPQQDAQSSQAPSQPTEPKEYEVESVVDTRVSKGVRFYRLRWKGYQAISDTWETEEGCKHCPELIADFWRQRVDTQASVSGGQATQSQVKPAAVQKRKKRQHRGGRKQKRRLQNKRKPQADMTDTTAEQDVSEDEQTDEPPQQQQGSKESDMPLGSASSPSSTQPVSSNKSKDRSILPAPGTLQPISTELPVAASIRST